MRERDKEREEKKTIKNQRKKAQWLEHKN